MNSRFIIQNPKLLTFGLLSVALCLVSGCQLPQRANNVDFPEVMVGTWEVWFSPEQRWQITFDQDGHIPAIIHNVFGPMKADEGGIHRDGPHPDTFMIAVLGPLETKYKPKVQKLEATISIDSYTMRFVEGELKGRMIDKFEGPISTDGKTWEVEWRDYGWLEGAAEPPMDVIDANPRIIVFKKVESDQ